MTDLPDPAGDGLPPIREVVRRHGIVWRTRSGQHFVHDFNVTRRVARAAGDLRGRDVLEVGAGPGGLTRALLLEGAARVWAVERDRRCLPALEEVAARWPGRLTVLEGDALAMDPKPPRGFRIVANLPYQIAAPLLVRWLTAADWPPPWLDATVMVQKEMADRIAATPGSRAYGRLSVLAQWRTRPRVVMRVPPEVFVPPPKVRSSLLRLVPDPCPSTGFAPSDLERATAAAFGNRRKTLRRSLARLGRNVEDVLESAGLDAGMRAQDVPVSGYCAIARALAVDRGRSADDGQPPAPSGSE